MKQIAILSIGLVAISACTTDQDIDVNPGVLQEITDPLAPGMSKSAVRDRLGLPLYQTHNDQGRSCDVFGGASQGTTGILVEVQYQNDAVQTSNAYQDNGVTFCTLGN